MLKTTWRGQGEAGAKLGLVSPCLPAPLLLLPLPRDRLFELERVQEGIFLSSRVSGVTKPAGSGEVRCLGQSQPGTEPGLSCGKRMGVETVPRGLVVCGRGP